MTCIHVSSSHAISPISFLSEVEGGGDSGDSSSGGDGSMSAAVGAITGAVCGLYGIYVVVGSASVLIIYWLLPLTTGEYALLVLLTHYLCIYATVVCMKFGLLLSCYLTDTCTSYL